jgi:hypothetical protein
MRRFLACPLALAVAASGMALWPATSASAASATASPNPADVTGLQSGYWWQSQPDGTPLPPPPQVPQNGLWVSSDPSGTQAESAIRFTLGEGMTAPVLTLSVSDAQPAQTVSVVACPVAPTSAQWKPPGTAGAWSSRPAADCAKGSIAGQLSADGKTMRFDLSQLSTIDTSLVNVVIVPAAIPDPASALPGTPATASPSFDLTFNQVATSDVAATAGAVTTPSDASDVPSPLPAPIDQPSVPAPVSSFDASAPALPSAPLEPPPVSAAAPAAAPLAPPPVELAVPAAAHSSSKTPTTRQRWILLSLLVDLALFAAWEERRRQSGAGHVRLSLYEIPTVSREAARQLERNGSPPPLR